MLIENQVVWVTGGASGLGAACAAMATKQGAKVVVFDLNDEPPAGLVD